MRLIVISDTHGDYRKLEEILMRHQEDANAVIFLGDGLRDLDLLIQRYPKLKYYAVAGNCDYNRMEKRVDLIFEGGKRIFITHGDQFGVKSSTERLVALAMQHHADMVLFGHTHQGFSRYQDGLYLFNPGSPSCPRDSKPSYGIIDIPQSGIFPNLVLL